MLRCLVPIVAAITLVAVSVTLLIWTVMVTVITVPLLITIFSGLFFFSPIFGVVVTVIALIIIAPFSFLLQYSQQASVHYEQRTDLITTQTHVIITPHVESPHLSAVTFFTNIGRCKMWWQVKSVR